VDEQLVNVVEVQLEDGRDLAEQGVEKSDNAAIMFVHSAIHGQDAWDAESALEGFPCCVTLPGFDGGLGGLKGRLGLLPMFLFGEIEEACKQGGQEKERSPCSESCEPSPPLPCADTHHQPSKHPQREKDKASVKTQRIGQDTHHNERQTDSKQTVREVEKRGEHVDKASDSARYDEHDPSLGVGKHLWGSFWGYGVRDERALSPQKENDEDEASGQSITHAL
jgi:hypothetical protein